jgi:hypothetical protein
MAFALRKWMEGAICTKDGSIEDMGFRRCIVTAKEKMRYGNGLEERRCLKEIECMA